MSHRRRVKPITLVDGQTLGEIEQVRNALKLARQMERVNSQGLADETPRLERQLVELSQQATDEALVLTVQALPGVEFADISRRHPPSSEQFDLYQQRLKAAPWLASVLEPPKLNDETMGPELFAAALVEPAWSKDEVNRFWADLSKAEQNYLWNEVHDLQVNPLGADLPLFSAVTAMTSGGGEPWTMPANGASPSHSS